MPRNARADFACLRCANDPKVNKAGIPPDDFAIADLPIDSTRCPICGRKRGFKRLFNKVQISTRGHRAARFIDKRMRPNMDKVNAEKAGAQEFESAAQTALDKAWHEATPEQRAQLVESKVIDPKKSGKQTGVIAHRIPVAQAFGAIEPGARMDSRLHTYPMVKRHIKPEWQK